jgi:tetratricopeptide (TPR) repeat protein
MAIEARVARLPQAAHETLQLAAILGREFGFDVLSRASELDEEGLLAALETAEHAQLIQEVPGRREVTFSFSHGLIATTLAAEVHTLRRRKLHRRAATAVEAVHRDDDSALAHHWLAAGDDAKALTYCTRAGERASAAYANVEAERYFRAALELAEAAVGRAPLLSELGQALARQSRYWQAVEVWKEAIGLYGSLGDWSAVGRLYARSARAAWNAGDTLRGLSICREGMALVGGGPDSVGLAELLHETARACHFSGLPVEVDTLGRQALEMAERLGEVRVQADALTTLSLQVNWSAEDALAALSRAAEVAEAAGLPTEAARAHHNMAFTLAMRQGQFAEARHHFGRSADLLRQTGAVTEELFSRELVVAIGLLQGDLAFAEQELPVLRRLLEKAPDPGTAELTLGRSEALLRRFRGELALAVEQLASLCARAQAAGSVQMLLSFLGNLIDPLLECGREAEAEAALQAAAPLQDRVEGWFSPASQLALYRAKQGQLAAARQLLADVLVRAVDRPLGFLDCILNGWTEATVGAAEQRWPDAWAAYEDVIDKLTQAGMRWYRAQVLRDWAEAHLARGQTGDGGRARELMREAMGDFTAIGAPYYAQQLQERLEAMNA